MKKSLTQLSLVISLCLLQRGLVVSKPRGDAHMLHRRKLMKKISILFLLILLTFSIAFSNSYEVFYSGSVEGKTIKAISVDRIFEEQELDELVGPLNGQNFIVLVYKDYKLYNWLEPLAVYIDDVRESYNPKFESHISFVFWNTTIQDKINISTNTNATIAYICKNYYLVAEFYNNLKCSKNNGILVQIKNKSYR